MKLKRIFAAVTAFALCASLAGCGAAATVSESAAESAAESAVESTPAVTEAPATEETADASEAALRIAGLKGPTTMGLVNLMSDEVASNYNFTMYGAADEIVPLLVKGDLDAAAVPANLAATLYNKTNGAVEVACINTLGVLYIVENGETVNSVGDLKGQTIVTTGKGATPEYVLRYVLTENGVDPDSDVTIEYCSEATEALSKVQAGEATIAMLPQPFVTSAMSQVEGLRVALDMNEEWQKVAGSKLVTLTELKAAVLRHVTLGELAETTSEPGKITSSPNGDWLEGLLAARKPFSVARRVALSEFERRYVERLLQDNDGNVARAAAASGIALRHFQRVKSKHKER